MTAYVKQTWSDSPSTASPLSAARLNHMEDGIDGGAYDSGTIAARPAAATFGLGFYFASDVDGGTLYYSDGSTWAQQGAGVNGGGGGRETARVEFGTFDVATGGAAQDITGATFSGNVPLTSLAQDLEVVLPSMSVLSWGSSSAVRVSAIVSVYSGATLIAFRGTPYATRFFPKAATDPAAPENVGFGAQVALLTLPRFIHRIPASTAAANYKLSIQLFAYDGADGAVTDVTVRVATNATYAPNMMRVLTVAS